MTTRRAVLGGMAGLLAAPGILRASAGGLRAGLPDWARIRLAVPNDPLAPDAYATLPVLCGLADHFVSENLTKPGFTMPEPGRFDFSAFDDQRKAVEALAPGAQFDLHGAVWHSSLPPWLGPALRRRPGDAAGILTAGLDAALAHHPFLSIDVNEVQRATGKMDAGYEYWRGPVEALDRRAPVGQNGSVWYEAFARQPDWPHDPGYWWLTAVGWANARGVLVAYQDFGVEAGQPWAGGDRAPRGQRADAAEPLKRRRILDAVNYALALGYRIDRFSFQAHLRPQLALDAEDLTGFLRSLRAMGLSVDVTELDVEQPGETAAACTAAFLGLLLRDSDLVRVGGWTGWAPQGAAPRQAMVDRFGVTPVGRAVIDGLSRASAPTDRARLPSERYYMLTHGVSGDQWRAAKGSGAAFLAEGGQRGTAIRPGSGGAVLPLTNRAMRPGAAPAAVRIVDGQVADYDAAAMGIRFQWLETAKPGPRLCLLAGDRVVLTLLRDGAGLVLRSATGEWRTEAAPGQQTLCALCLGPGRVQAAIGQERAQLSPPLVMDAQPDRLILGGDGVAESDILAVRLVLRAEDAGALGDPAARLRQDARPAASDFLSF